MKHFDIISAGFWFLFGSIVTGWSVRYPIGSIANPGPGLYPLGLGLLLIALSLVLLFQALKAGLSSGNGPGFPARGGLKNVGYVTGVLLVASFLFEWAGFVLTVFLSIFLLNLEGRMGNWKKSLLFAVLTVAGVYMLFVLLLGQQLPHGFFGV